MDLGWDGGMRGAHGPLGSVNGENQRWSLLGEGLGVGASEQEVHAFQSHSGSEEEHWPWRSSLSPDHRAPGRDPTAQSSRWALTAPNLSREDRHTCRLGPPPQPPLSGAAESSLSLSSPPQPRPLRSHSRWQSSALAARSRRAGEREGRQGIWTWEDSGTPLPINSCP